MVADAHVLRVLEGTSRTFYLPVVRLPDGLKPTVAASYLCMRALDEIEDHPQIENQQKADLLNGISQILQSQTAVESFGHQELDQLFQPHQKYLPEVSLRLGEWCCHAPAAIAPRIWEATSAMADRMAHWTLRNWNIKTEADLNGYTYSVAGAVGLLLCDIWAWFDGSQIDRITALHFGRALQAVNILRNRAEDLERKVDFFPDGWSREQMFAYARAHMEKARSGGRLMPRNAFKYLVEIPLLLADATLHVMERGEKKLSRSAVLHILDRVSKSEPVYDIRSWESL